MNIKTYYKIYRKRPIEEKIDLMLESMHWAAINRANAERCDIWRNDSDKRYYRNEEQAMHERTRLMRGLVLQEIKDLKEWKVRMNNEIVEPLTDMEQRIFLAVMGNEERVCKKVFADDDVSVNLVMIYHEIIRKVKKTLLGKMNTNNTKEDEE